MFLAPASTFIASSFTARRSTSSESPPTAPISKDKMKELGKAGKNVTSVTSWNFSMKLIKYYYKIEMGKKEKNIRRPL